MCEYLQAYLRIYVCMYVKVANGEICRNWNDFVLWDIYYMHYVRNTIDGGHDSKEDAIACMDLMKWKINRKHLEEDL